MPNPWVIAALAGFSVVAFFVYLSELDQPPLAPPHYQYARNRDSNNANSKKNDDAHKRADDDDDDDDQADSQGDQLRQDRVTTTVTSGAHRFPGSVGSGSMIVRRRSRTTSAGSRQDSPSFATTQRSSPPPPAYAPTLPSTSHLESSIELQPLQSSPSTTNTTSNHDQQEEALALASELEDTERQLQALLVKREQLALRQSQIDLRELAAQAAAAAAQQQHSPSSLSLASSSATSVLFDAPNPFATSDEHDQEDGGLTELDKMRDNVAVEEAVSQSAGSSVSGSLVSVPHIDANAASVKDAPVSPSTSGFDSSPSESRSGSSTGSDKRDVAVVTTAAPEGEFGQDDARSESEFSLVSAGSA